VVRRGAQVVLDRLDLEVAAAESVAVLGRSGAGKTTLLRVLAGLEPPDAGRIAFGEVVVNAPGVSLAPWRRGVGMVFQSSALWPHLTVGQNIAFALQDRPREWRRARTAELLDAIGLSGLEARYPHAISGGEARRVALARAVAGDPPVLLLDEALTHLDAETKGRLVELIGRLARGRATMVVVTHDPDEARLLADRTLELAAGALEPRL
jgi:ABC-type sulfate/molybdate transport systems ATPase subunit